MDDLKKLCEFCERAEDTLTQSHVNIASKSFTGTVTLQRPVGLTPVLRGGCLITEFGSKEQRWELEPVRPAARLNAPSAVSARGDHTDG